LIQALGWKYGDGDDLSAMAAAACIHFILGVVGQYAISAAVKAIFECE